MPRRPARVGPRGEFAAGAVTQTEGGRCIGMRRRSDGGDQGPVVGIGMLEEQARRRHRRRRLGNRDQRRGWRSAVEVLGAPAVGSGSMPSSRSMLVRRSDVARRPVGHHLGEPRTHGCRSGREGPDRPPPMPVAEAAATAWSRPTWIRFLAVIGTGCVRQLGRFVHQGGQFRTGLGGGVGDPGGHGAVSGVDRRPVAPGLRRDLEQGADGQAGGHGNREGREGRPGSGCAALRHGRVSVGPSAPRGR